jgi:uncharacterized cupredoxin-like copper-binding protein
VNTKLILNAIAFTTAIVAGSAWAHGDEEHSKSRIYDASKVEDTPFGRGGNAKAVTRTIKVDMADNMRFTPADVTVKRGETVRFVVHNGGKVLHEMVLGTKEALQEHADANMAHVQPGKAGEIVWQFAKAGEFEFACLQPGHFEAGMVGKVTVK